MALTTHLPITHRLKVTGYRCFERELPVEQSQFGEIYERDIIIASAREALLINLPACARCCQHKDRFDSSTRNRGCGIINNVKVYS